MTWSRPGFELSLVAVVRAPCQSPHSRSEGVLGKVDDEVSSDPVYGKVLENRRDTDDSPYSVNLPAPSRVRERGQAGCLANSTDPNYSVAFAVNFIDAIGCRAAISDNLFQDGTLATCHLPLATRRSGNLTRPDLKEDRDV